MGDAKNNPVDLRFDLDEDRRIKPPEEKLHREVQVLLNDETYLALLRVCPKNIYVSKWIRMMILRDPEIVAMIAEIREAGGSIEKLREVGE